MADIRTARNSNTSSALSETFSFAQLHRRCICQTQERLQRILANGQFVHIVDATNSSARRWAFQITRTIASARIHSKITWPEAPQQTIEAHRWIREWRHNWARLIGAKQRDSVDLLSHARILLDRHQKPLYYTRDIQSVPWARRACSFESDLDNPDFALLYEYPERIET